MTDMQPFISLVYWLYHNIALDYMKEQVQLTVLTYCTYRTLYWY